MDRQDISQAGGERGRLKDDREIERGVILGQCRHPQRGRFDTVESVEVRKGQGSRQLARTVSAIVEEQHRIVVPQQADRLIVRIGHDAGLNELIGRSVGIGLFDHGHGVPATLAATSSHDVVASPRAVPPLVTIHRVVASADRRDAANPGVGAHIL